MKRHPKLIFFTLIAFLAALGACSHPNDGGGPCTDPIQEYHFPANASRWLFDPMKPGDSIKFKVYHRADRSAPYIFRKNETFVIKDTMIKRFTTANIYAVGNCNEQMIANYFTADITGPESITCQLDDGSITRLIITLKDKIFKVDAGQYNSHYDGWKDSLTIDHTQYTNVKFFTGGGGNGYYKDSTYCFYNLQYGMLKFIINDTLIYQRNLH